MKKNMIITILSIITVLLIGSFANAAPGEPHFFKGLVTTNGEPAADGIFITAKIIANNQEKVVESKPTKFGAYGFNPDPGSDDLFYSFYVRDPYNDMQGKTIYFYVGDVKAAEYTFNEGDFTRLDLSVDGDFPSSSSSSSSSGSSSSSSSGSSSGSSGGSSSSSSGSSSSSSSGSSSSSSSGSPPPIPFEDESCTPEWQCGEWLDCVNGQQKRTCIDLNECDSEEGMPETVQECVVPQDLEEKRKASPVDEPSTLNKITGAVTGGGVGTWASLIIVLAIIVGLVLYGRMKARKK